MSSGSDTTNGGIFVPKPSYFAVRYLSVAREIFLTYHRSQIGMVGVGTECLFECTQLRDDGTWLGKLGSVKSSVVSAPSKGWHIRFVLILGPGFL